MSLARTYLSGWGVGEKLTSAQIGAVDANIENALDKRVAQTDTLGSHVKVYGVLQATGAGRFIDSIATGPDADRSFYANENNRLVRVPTLTDARAFTLGSSGATGGDRITFFVQGTGSTASGYVDIKNSVGTGLFRLGMLRTPTGMSEQAEGEHAEFLFDGSEWQLLMGGRPGVRTIPYLSNGLWTCPPGVFKILVYGCGGGGGGGGGKPNSTSANRWISGGGGGGAAEYKSTVLDVIPGRTYEVYVGAGGAGGSAGNTGDPGGSSGIYDPILADYLNFFRGAQGGRTQVTTYGISSNGFYRAHGGAPTAFPTTRGWGNFADDLVMDAVPSGIASFGLALPAGTGGAGNGTDTGVAGSINSYGSFSGGAGGAKGADSGTERGGGGGGGGGAGAFGNGAAGGAGGAGGTPGAGSAGSNADANSGAGGGGGGSGGTAAAGSGAGGAGGNGGSGRLVIVYIR